MKSNKIYAVFGLGRYGLAVAKELVDNGVEVLAVDIDENIVNNYVKDKLILSVNDLEDFVKTNKVDIAIITVPKEEAQTMCDKVTELNIKVIWNFAPINIIAKDDVRIKNENIILW